MRKLFIIGIGAGNPDYMTVEAVNALNGVDVVLVLDKGERKSDLTRLRKDIVERFAGSNRPRWVEAPSPVRDAANASYKSGVADWHAAKGEAFSALIREAVGDGETAAILVWGDPSLYDSTLRIVEQLAHGGIVPDYEVIPGISSLHALTARHRIPLNPIGEPVLITTGRRLAERMPEGVDTIAVLLDGGAGLEALAGQDMEIYWGAYLGTPDEILIAGHVRDVLDDVRRIRSARRVEKGWIMDTYLLRRRAG